MPRPKPIACVSLPGGASHAAAIAGAADARDETIDVPGWAGVSAGALVAVAKAFAVEPERVRRMLRHALASNRLLDVAPLELGDLGLCGWHVVPTLIDEIIGPGAKMGDALTALVVVVTDLHTGRPVYLSRKHTPHVLVREACRASSAIPFVAPQLPIPSFTGPDVLYADGGCTDNTADAVWDSWSIPRVAVRLREPGARHDVHHGDPLGQSLAIVRALLHGAQSLKSERSDGVVVDVEAIGDGMDFSLSAAQVDARYRAGYDSVMRHRARLATIPSQVTP